MSDDRPQCPHCKEPMYVGLGFNQKPECDNKECLAHIEAKLTQIQTQTPSPRNKKPKNPWLTPLQISEATDSQFYAVYGEPELVCKISKRKEFPPILDIDPTGPPKVLYMLCSSRTYDALNRCKDRTEDTPDSHAPHTR